jgi:hypothetical protein
MKQSPFYCPCCLLLTSSIVSLPSHSWDFQRFCLAVIDSLSPRRSHIPKPPSCGQAVSNTPSPCLRPQRGRKAHQHSTVLPASHHLFRIPLHRLCQSASYGGTAGVGSPDFAGVPWVCRVGRKALLPVVEEPASSEEERALVRYHFVHSCSAMYWSVRPQ